jgi:MoaA/NifB/PqqE/SkfB family radical SAM enzyme
MRYIDPPAKLLKHLDRVETLRQGKYTPPINVEIDLSNRCSLGCEGCHFGYTHTKGPLANSPKPPEVEAMGDQMPLDLALDICDQLEAAGVRSITWTGGGEPTLHPAFDEIIEYCRLPQGMYTNGGHIDQRRAEIIKTKMTWVYISLDYSDKWQYELYKKAKRWDHVMSGIKHLVEAPGTATVGIGFLLWKENWTNMYDMVNLAQGMGADYVQFRPMILHKLDEPGKVQEDTRWMDDMIGMLDYWRKVPGVVVDIDRFRQYKEWQGHGYSTCWWSGLQTVITPNGKAWTCVNRRGFAGDEIGDLTQERFTDIWKRVKPHRVDSKCRVFCRGHIPNTLIDKIIKPGSEHDLFV